jgi:hypothetical protein
MKNAVRMAGIALATSAGVGVATTLLPASLEDLCDFSDVIVEGRIVRSWCDWNDDPRQIVTRLVLDIEETFKGPRHAEILIEELGGSIDGLTTEVGCGGPPVPA